MSTANTKKAATILIVEDEDALRAVLRGKLQSCHFATLEANNGKDAVRLALSHHPDLILLDLALPIMDGMAALKKIRESPAGRHLPVIILTNLDASNTELVEDMVAQRPSYYLVKSDWKMQDVVTKVKELLATK